MKEYLKVIFETEEKDYFCIWQTDLNSGFYKDGDHVACLTRMPRQRASA